MYPENYIYMGTFIQPIQNFFFSMIKFLFAFSKKGYGSM